MKQKKKGKTELSVIAQDLTKLAGSIADGRLEVGGDILELEGTGYWKIEKSIKKNTSVVKVEIKVPIRGDAQQGFEHFEKYKGVGKARAKRPYKAKRVKKEMGDAWKLIKRQIRQGLIPEDSDVELLWRSKEEYQVLVEDVWAKDWDECIKQTEKALNAAKQGDFEKAMAFVEKVDRLKSMCHKKYK